MGNETVMGLLRHSIKCTVMLALTSSLDVSFLLEVLGTLFLYSYPSYVRFVAFQDCTRFLRWSVKYGLNTVFSYEFM